MRPPAAARIIAAMRDHELPVRLQVLSEAIVLLGGTTAEVLLERARQRWSRWHSDFTWLQAAVALLLEERARARQAEC
jgi:hypothetical protein